MDDSSAADSFSSVAATFQLIEQPVDSHIPQLPGGGAATHQLLE
jgi:hypothetical protein